MAISRRTHPFFERDEDRGKLWTRAEREITHSLRVGTIGGWQHVSFLDQDDSFAHIGGDIVLDTRLDPMLARNAVYGRAAWTHFAFRNGDALTGAELEGRGYLGLFGQSVLVVRALRDDADKPRPAYLQPMLGSLANLRGFRAGTAVGELIRTIDEQGAEFRSHLDGSLNFLGPESATAAQIALGADIIMAFDECTEHPATRERARDSMELTLRWAQRSRTYFHQHKEEVPWRSSGHPADADSGSGGGGNQGASGAINGTAVFWVKTSHGISNAVGPGRPDLICWNASAFPVRPS